MGYSQSQLVLDIAGFQLYQIYCNDIQLVIGGFWDSRIVRFLDIAGLQLYCIQYKSIQLVIGGFRYSIIIYKLVMDCVRYSWIPAISNMVKQYIAGYSRILVQLYSSYKRYSILAYSQYTWFVIVGIAGFQPYRIQVVSMIVCASSTKIPSLPPPSRYVPSVTTTL